MEFIAPAISNIGSLEVAVVVDNQPVKRDMIATLALPLKEVTDDDSSFSGT